MSEKKLKEYEVVFKCLTQLLYDIHGFMDKIEELTSYSGTHDKFAQKVSYMLDELETTCKFYHDALGHTLADLKGITTYSNFLKDRYPEIKTIITNLKNEIRKNNDEEKRNDSR